MRTLRHRFCDFKCGWTTLISSWCCLCTALSVDVLAPDSSLGSSTPQTCCFQKAKDIQPLFSPRLSSHSSMFSCSDLIYFYQTPITKVFPGACRLARLRSRSRPPLEKRREQVTDTPPVVSMHPRMNKEQRQMKCLLLCSFFHSKHKLSASASITDFQSSL